MKSFDCHQTPPPLGRIFKYYIYMVYCNYGFIITCSGARSAQGIVDTAMQKLKSLVNERLTGKSGGGGGGGSGGGGKKGVSGSFLLFKCIIVTFWNVYYNFWQASTYFWFLYNMQAWIFLLFRVTY